MGDFSGSLFFIDILYSCVGSEVNEWISERVHANILIFTEVCAELNGYTKIMLRVKRDP